MGVSSRRKAARANRISRTLSRTVVINSLRLGWIVALVAGELGVYFYSLSSCKWPERNEWRRGKPTHVLLISDPQVRHPSVSWRRQSLRQTLYEALYELNLKRSWHVTQRLNPHAVFFLGDMLSSGKFVRSEAEYASYWRKFQQIFPGAPSSPHYYIPGNNDVGMGLSHSSPKNVRLYYSNVVGPFNRQVVIRDHVFVCLDAPGLVDDDYQRSGTPYDHWSPAHGGSVEFVKSFVHDSRPTILLSHIPMARPDSASCGPLREKGTIRRGVGHGYQNTLGKHTTAFLLNAIQPSAIFSGDNRDYCEFNHTVDLEVAGGSKSVREISIKSFSMSVHIKRPGFQLLSLVDPTTSGTSMADTLCLLPDTAKIYGSLYTPFALLTLIFLFVFNIYRSKRLRNAPLPPMSLSPLSSNDHSPNNLGAASPWSPFTPAVPLSPRNKLPPSLRTPNATPGPTMRASRPATPLGSPMLTPAIIFQADEDEDDTLYPAQYAMQRNGHIDDEEWPAPRDDPAPAFFLPAPGNPKPVAVSHGWSWTFVFRGRRRRMALSIPTWRSLLDLVSLLAPGSDSDMILRRKGLFWATIADVLGVLWPTVLLWIIFAWWML
ncbi:Metallophos domain-containing protein [Mycena indigotica]|uniref:Metallophos domain-containing protein n=1 Tax=Mycena indigotica TaxID=2126181 RepID=A0A8H6TF39_9AGAR|nr:Metallophos domain-containing protein [Mycena indigotica]KAF7315537.1 Metallophos domain-containing protein [Mycena indigotica]